MRDVDPDKWNTLAEKIICELRKLNKTRKVIVGSICWNSPDTLKDLKMYDDENIIYTFHMYSPFEFTHQKGVLQAEPLYYNCVMPYPCDIERYRDFHKVVHNDIFAYREYAKMDIAYMRQVLQPAVDFTNQHPEFPAAPEYT